MCIYRHALLTPCRPLSVSRGENLLCRDPGGLHVVMATRTPRDRESVRCIYRSYIKQTDPLNRRQYNVVQQQF